MKILVTAGATRERIDSVRYISNISTGVTGASLAGYFSETGHDVHLLAGTGAASSARTVQITRYTDFADLDDRLKRLLSEKSFDVVIHAAAVSDYSVGKIRDGAFLHFPGAGKISSSSEEIQITLRRNHKIIDRLSAYSRTPIRIVGFKLTRTSDFAARKQAVAAVFGAPSVDFVVHNDLGEISATRHPFTVFTKSDVAGNARNALDLARLLERVISKEAQ